MSWHDRIARETIIQLQKDFKIRLAVETGTFKGVNVEWLCQHFPHVRSVENNKEYYEIASKRLHKLNCSNYILFNEDSHKYLAFLNSLRGRGIIKDLPVYFYLDAHFYDPKRKQKFVVVDELKALEGFRDCIICIHDFDNSQFGGLCYDGQRLDWNAVGKYLKQINPDFSYYTNTECDIYTEGNIEGVTVDEIVLDNIRTFKGKDQRGLLYATPAPLDLNKYKLRKI